MAKGKTNAAFQKLQKNANAKGKSIKGGKSVAGRGGRGGGVGGSGG